MNYKKEIIKKGISLHVINTDKFKTNLCTIMLTTPLKREDVAKNALISLVLRRGTKNLDTQDKISKEFENMYGANFDCGIEKMGDNHVLKFFIESLNDDYIEEKNNLEKSINLLFDIVFNPYIENEQFKQEYFDQEKEKLKQIIEAKKDNKSLYAFNRCIEEMYKDKPFGVYKFGDIKDLENINNKDLYNVYLELINNSKIDIFISGNVGENSELINIINKNVINLKDRVDKSIKDSREKYVSNVDVKTVEETADITQGKLIIGLNGYEEVENGKNIAMIYNGILGGTANSKLFQNVREKASLAYTCGSNYLKSKGNIFIRAGIEIKNYKKALEIIKKQIEDIANGDFTDEDIRNVKQFVYSGIDQIKDEQDSLIIYYFNQELNEKFISLDEYKSGIEKVNKQEIIDYAKSIKINTIYFLKN